MPSSWATGTTLAPHNSSIPLPEAADVNFTHQGAYARGFGIQAQRSQTEERSVVWFFLNESSAFVGAFGVVPGQEHVPEQSRHQRGQAGHWLAPDGATLAIPRPR